MARSIGVLATHYLWVGIVEDTELGSVRMYPEPGGEHVDLKSIPAEEIIARVIDQIHLLNRGEPVDSVGAGFPGIIRCGVIEDSPNLPQLKGVPIQERLAAAFKAGGIDAPVTVVNDANALAAGIAATRGRLEKLIRVWYLGDGIGYGRFPHPTGVCECGHSVGSLTPRSASAAAAAWGTWKASWGIEPCGCASSTWSRKRSS